MKHPPIVTFRIPLPAFTVQGRDYRQGPATGIRDAFLVQFLSDVTANLLHVAHQKRYILEHIMVDALKKIVRRAGILVHQVIAVVDMTTPMDLGG
jgi:hypothetical protein